MFTLENMEKYKMDMFREFERNFFPHTLKMGVKDSSLKSI